MAGPDPLAAGLPPPSVVALFEQLPDAVYLLDPDSSRIVWCNRAGWASLGLSPTEVLDHSVLSLQMDVSGAPAWADIASVIRASRTYTFVGRHRHAAGHEVAVEVLTRCVQIDGREYFLSVARDISRRMALDADLGQRENQLWFALNEAMDGLWDWNIVTGEVFFSPQLKRMLGYGPEEMTPHLETWSGNIHPDDAAQVLAALSDHLEGRRGRYEARYRLRNRNGEYRWVSDRGRICERGADGRPSRAVGMVQDVTAEHEAQQALAHSESAQRTLIAALPDVIMRFDREGRHLFVSENVTSLAPMLASEITGRTHRELGFPQPLCRQWDAELETVFTTGQPLESEFVLPGPQGPRIVSWRLSPDRDPAVGVRSVLAVCRDITARRQAESELEQHRHRLEELVAERTAELAESTAAAQAANRAKTRFLATMSHELRTPMTAILGMTAAALRRTDDPSIREPLHKADRAAQHLLQVINDVLDISRIEAERLTLEDAEITLATLLDSLEQMTAHRAEQRGQRWTVDLPAELAAIPLRGDPLRLKQVLLNLVDNAIKFTERGEVAVRVASPDAGADPLPLRIEVRDTGIGIAPQHLDRVFEPFEQVDATTTRGYGGTGLGLAICRRLVQMMGGTIGAESQPGHGSRFWVELCLRRSLAEPPATLRSPMSALDGADPARLMDRLRRRHAGARILVVEDEPVSREVVTEMLALAGLSTDQAEDGAAALALARQRRYDLVLMDMQMPGLSGPEVAPLVHAETPNARTPIVALTANAFDDDRQRCLEAGMVAHLSKPVDAARLYGELLRWLDQAGAAPAA